MSTAPRERFESRVKLIRQWLTETDMNKVAKRHEELEDRIAEDTLEHRVIQLILLGGKMSVVEFDKLIDEQRKEKYPEAL